MTSQRIGIRQVSDSERAILEFLSLSDGEGCTLAHDIAVEVGVKPRSMGGRLRELERCAFIKRVLVRRARSAWSDKLYGWVITDAGREVLR
jgi:hypothetical protein